jgi:hypothetical protein
MRLRARRPEARARESMAAGDRYLLKLFRDVFHHVGGAGSNSELG